MKDRRIKIQSLVQLYEILPDNERIITDVLRQIIIQALPKEYKEKILYNVPFFYGRKSICIIWPSAMPGGGIKEGVLLRFWYGNKLNHLFVKKMVCFSGQICNFVKIDNYGQTGVN